jgi:hypothetical protein
VIPPADSGAIVRCGHQLARHSLIIVELALALAVVNLYEIEGVAFHRVMALAASGFLVSIVLPPRFRLPFFVVLSFVAIFWVLDLVDGAWLVALGLILLGIARLRAPIGLRVALLVTAAGALAALRVGFAETPWSAAVWPILGSMFMFRMVLYMRAVSSGRAEGGVWGALAYFFMLPNVAFPLFPVVDFQTFQRTHFDRAEREIYDQGLLWISRGLVHLVLYRFVYSIVLNDPSDVERLSDLVRYMLATFLLYLRVSGQFHLIVGLLHLFGFRLPETHKRYYLGHSFTELWRRINIYWTDFMMKTVFYPTYFKLRSLGPVAPVAIATAAVFATTWLLHSYQWFWLRGGFPLTAPDVLFWGILGALVIWGGIKELRRPKRRRHSGRWSWRVGFNTAVTFCSFCFLWSLWSSESLGQWLWLLGASGTPDAAGIALAMLAFSIVFLLGGWNWEISRKSSSGWAKLLWAPAARTLVPLTVLVLVAHPAVPEFVSPRVADTLRALRSTDLNARDASLQHRGYYEQLDMRGQLSALNSVPQAPPGWQSASEAGIIRERADYLSRDLHPSRRIVWNDKVFSTNEHGMRDRWYSRVKPPGTIRIALLGPSHVMGNGVADSETFEALVEERLNAERAAGDGPFEILNFGVDGYSLPQQLAILEDRVLGFSPDVVILTTYHQGQLMTEQYLSKVLLSGARLPDNAMQAFLDEQRLPEGFRGNVPVPYEWARSLARSLGLAPRMPFAEAEARLHRIADDVNDRAIARIAELALSRDVAVAVLGLNGVIENVPTDVPNSDAIAAAGLPIINLFDVFPADHRASLRVAPWDDHPNAEGHRLIADRLYRELVPLLSAIRSGGTGASSTPREE